MGSAWEDFTHVFFTVYFNFFPFPPLWPGRSSRWMRLERWILKRNVSSRERLHDQNIGEKLNEDGEERKTKKLRNRRRISVSKAFHLQFTHTKVLRWLALKCGNWMVSSIVQSAFNFALITHRCRVWHWVSLFRRSRSREKGQESDQNRAL